MIFVMAATGEVGRAVVDELLRQGAAPSGVIAGARNTAKLAEFAASGVQVRQADYGVAKSMETAFQGAETLVLIPTKTEAAPRCVEHANALEAAKTAGIKRIIFLSIQAATPLSRFNVAPFILFAESATRLSGMQWTIARMSLYSDPVAEWAPELKQTGILPYPVVNARIAYVAKRDIARSLAMIARRNDTDGKIFELTGPAALSMPEVAGLLSDATETAIRFQSITEDDYRELCHKDKLPEEIIEILVTMYRAAEEQEFAKVTGDIETLTGTPPESMAATLSRILESS